MYRLYTSLLFISATSVFAYSNYWSVLNKSPYTISINRIYAEHGDFHCSTNGNKLNKDCMVAPNESATIHLTTTNNQIHEDFNVYSESIGESVGVQVKSEYANLPYYNFSLPFSTSSIKGGISGGYGIQFMLNPDELNQILVVGY